MSNKDYKEGYAKGIEDATKLVAGTPGGTYSMHYNLSELAEQIRALLLREKTK